MGARSSIWVGGDACAADPDDFGPLLEQLARIADPEELAYRVAMLPAPVQRRILDAWFWRAFDGQKPPKQAWRVWLVMAGRGFGKTRAGAEWVWARVRETGAAARIALVGGTIDEVRQVMVEGESGLEATARTGEWARWSASRRRVEFSNGAVGFAYSAERPEKLRGPEHHFAWCDELAKWPAGRGEKAWDNLQMTMRLGEAPRIAVTTTPKPTRLVRRVLAEAAGALTRGRMADNWTLPPGEVAAVTALYGGTRTGRQELDGELIAEVEGALWTRDGIERARSFDMASRLRSTPAQDERSFFKRVVVESTRPPRPRATPAGSWCAGSGMTGSATCSPTARRPGLRRRAGRRRWRLRPRPGGRAGWSPRPTMAGRW